MFSFLWCGIAYSQREAGAELYYYSHQPAGGAVQPAAWYLSPKGWYTAVRYNFEDVQTFSALIGKKWTSKSGHHSVIPMAGILYGSSKGGTLQLKAETEWGRFTATAEPLYVVAFTGKQDNFYYNWSEVSFALSKRLFAGAAVQHTATYSQQPLVEPGLFAGITLGAFELPVYVFKGAEGQAYFVGGLSWSWAK